MLKPLADCSKGSPASTSSSPPVRTGVSGHLSRRRISSGASRPAAPPPRGIPLVSRKAPTSDRALEFARLVNDDPLGARLETAYGRMTKVLALTIPEHETIIRALDDAPRGLRSSARCCSEHSAERGTASSSGTAYAAAENSWGGYPLRLT